MRKVPDGLFYLYSSRQQQQQQSKAVSNIWEQLAVYRSWEYFNFGDYLASC